MEVCPEEGGLLDGIDTSRMSGKELTSLQAAVPKYPILAQDIGEAGGQAGRPGVHSWPSLASLTDSDAVLPT